MDTKHGIGSNALPSIPGRTSNTGDLKSKAFFVDSHSFQEFWNIDPMHTLYTQKRLTSLLGLIFATVLFSCSEDEERTTDVYFSGYQHTPLTTTARSWKNGRSLGIRSDGNFSSAYSIFVSGSDVYVAGYDANSSKYWKNSVGNWLAPTSPGTAHCIFVSGQNVFVAGSEAGVATIWKNGVANKLTTRLDLNTFAFAKSVIVSDQDIYAAGLDGDTAKYWKNDVAYNLTDGSIRAMVWQIIVSGSDVYIVGHDGLKATYWKNGFPNHIDESKNHNFQAICIANGDIYIAGTISDDSGFGAKAAYWKNGEATLLSNADSDATCIAVSGADVYVGGQVFNFTSSSAVYWKNGELHTLPDGAGVTGIFLSR